MAERKAWALDLQTRYNTSIVMSCEVTGMSRSAFYYQAKGTDDGEIIAALNQLVEKHQRWGFPKCFKRLKAMGYGWNHKRVYRVYTELRLNMRRKTKRRLPTPLVTLNLSRHLKPQANHGQ